MPAEITYENLDARYFEIMKDVCQGKSFTITVDGRPVAEVRPSLRGDADVDAIKVLEELSSPRFEGAPDEIIRNGWGKSRHNGRSVLRHDVVARAMRVGLA